MAVRTTKKLLKIQPSSIWRRLLSMRSLWLLDLPMVPTLALLAPRASKPAVALRGFALPALLVFSELVIFACGANPITFLYFVAAALAAVFAPPFATAFAPHLHHPHLHWVHVL